MLRTSGKALAGYVASGFRSVLEQRLGASGVELAVRQSSFFFRMMPLQNPDAVAWMIRNFVARHDSGPAQAAR